MKNSNFLIKSGNLRFLIYYMILCLSWMNVMMVRAQDKLPQEEVSVFDPPGGSAMPFTGGYVREMSVPKNYESMHWGEDDFELHFSVGHDEAGNVVRVERIEHQAEQNQQWKKPFVASCKEALMLWKFAPVYDNKKNPVSHGLSIHVRFQKNKKLDYNVVVRKSFSSVLLTTNPDYIP